MRKVNIKLNNLNKRNLNLSPITFGPEEAPGPEVPDQITDFQGTNGDIEQTTLTWTIPSSPEPVTRVDIHYKLASDSQWNTFENVPTVANTQKVYALRKAEPWDFRIRYVNANGPAEWSSVVTITPILIVAPLYFLYNHEGIETSPVALNNTAPSPIAGDRFGTLLNAPNVTPNSHKGKNCFQTNGDAGILRDTRAAPLVAQPVTIFWCGIPFFLDSQFRRVVESSFQVSDITARNTDTNLFAGFNNYGGLPMDTSGIEWAFIGQADQTNSFMRVFKNDGGVTDVKLSGDSGGADFAIESMHWNVAQTPSLSLPAQQYVLGQYNGLLSAAEEEAVAGAIRQEHFVGVPGFSQPVIAGDFNSPDFDSNDFNTSV